MEYIVSCFEIKNSLQQNVFLSYLGDCDHLQPYPIFSDTQYLNLTSWNKPWRPEIDFLNSYANLSSYHSIVLEALAVGYRVTNYSKYFSSSEWGCILMFPWDPDLADAYYLQHYAHTNNTMYICTPRFPVRPDMRRKDVQTHRNPYSMVTCIIYQLGLLENLYKRGFSTVVLAFSPVFLGYIYVGLLALICITGILGELILNFIWCWQLRYWHSVQSATHI